MYSSRVVGFFGNIVEMKIKQFATYLPGETAADGCYRCIAGDDQAGIFRETVCAVGRRVVKRTRPYLPVFKAVYGMDVRSGHGLFFL